MFIVKHRAWFFTLSALLVLGSLFCLWRFGLPLGIDFTGGTILELAYPAGRPDIEAVRQAAAGAGLGVVTVQPVGDRGLLFRLQTITAEQKEVLLKVVRPGANQDQPIEKRFSAVGPTLGRELARKGIIALVVTTILILAYIALVFRKVSKPVSSWIYGLITLVTMFHDVIIPTGIFVLLGVFYGITIDALFLTAFLTILGLSVNDKIVVLDRIRENLKHSDPNNFPAVVGRSLTETLTRSINTSVTIILVLLAVFWFGGESTQYFALALAIGMVVATYSSIFIAAPLLVAWQQRRRGDSIKS